MARVSLITGGSRGIGFAVAQALLREGDSVAITATSADGVAHAARVLGEEAGSPDRVLGLTCDVREAASVEAALHSVESRFGGLDVLVNNAGVGVGAPIADLAAEEWHRIIDTNLTGVFHCTKAAIPRFRRRGSGWIISISSLASKNPFVGGAAYCASKAALNAFCEALMQEVRHENIRVSYVLPGSVATGFSGRPASAGSDWRLQPDDVAHVIVDLLAHPARSLPSRVEIRPSQPQKS
jgi:NAD(P)-dependent dehydrogenase (short-subunit alcohol dehydrogenase family)